MRASEIAPTAGSTGAEPNGSRQLTEAVLDQGVEVDPFGQLVLERRDLATGRGSADPDAVELREFLPQAHRGDQRVDPPGRGQGQVVPSGDDAAAFCRTG